jgi:hypothetical protein
MMGPAGDGDALLIRSLLVRHSLYGRAVKPRGGDGRRKRALPLGVVE